MTGERSKQLEEIVRLCAEIETASANADWNAAGELLSDRQRLVESVFAGTAETAADVEELTAIARQVMAFDAKLKPLADAARGATAGELKGLRRSREVAEAYKRNSSQAG